MALWCNALCAVLNSFLQKGEYILFDGAAKSEKSAPHLKGPIYAAKNNKWAEYTDAECDYDRKQVNNRAVVENYFSRLKCLCKCMYPAWGGSRKSFLSHFRACIALTNMHIVLMSPLRRKHTCEVGDCYYCMNVRGDKEFDPSIVVCKDAIHYR